MQSNIDYDKAIEALHHTKNEMDRLKQHFVQSQKKTNVKNKKDQLNRLHDFRKIYSPRPTRHPIVKKAREFLKACDASIRLLDDEIKNHHDSVPLKSALEALKDHVEIAREKVTIALRSKTDTRAGLEAVLYQQKCNVKESVDKAKLANAPKPQRSLFSRVAKKILRLFRFKKSSIYSFFKPNNHKQLVQFHSSKEKLNGIKASVTQTFSNQTANRLN